MKNTLKRLLFSFFIILMNFKSASLNGASIEPILEKQEVVVVKEQVQLFCRLLGKGDPIVILHGGPGLSHDYLFPQLTELAKTHLVIFYDQRGCGRSTAEINAHSINMKAFISDLDAIRNHFGFQKISLLGHSWGGFLAMHYTLAHPESVDKLILSNCLPASSREIQLFITEYVKRTSPYQEQLRQIRNSKEFAEGSPSLVKKYYEIIFRTYCFQPESAAKLNLKMTPNAAVNGIKVANILRETLFSESFDLHEKLKELDISTLIIHGETDPIAFCTAEALHQSIPHSKYVLMNQCGHFPYVEDPQRFFVHLNKFLNETVDRHH